MKSKSYGRGQPDMLTGLILLLQAVQLRSHFSEGLTIVKACHQLQLLLRACQGERRML